MIKTAEAPRILVVDDKRNILTVLESFLHQEGYRVATAQGGREAYRRALHEHPDLILCDIRMDDIDGLQLAAMLQSQGLSPRFVFMTAFATIEGAVDAMKSGAYDYLTKPLDYDRLSEVIRRALSAHAAPDTEGDARRIVGSSPAMMNIFRRIAAVAQSNATVLIHGESGTGKELIARAIHRQSRRAEAAFVPVHCASFAASLLESELFGYEKGAFTGAAARKAGFFEVADGGTLFLDEVSEIPAATQVSLLRVLQERSFTRVGGTEFVRVDVRLIAATNRELQAAVAAGSFREDLFYRLNVIPIRVPPLRERASDIPEITAAFLQETCPREGLAVPDLEPGALHAMSEYRWPGNVRELHNILERIVVLHRPERITKDLFLSEVQFTDPAHHEFASDERERIIEAIRRTGGNKSDAARLLGLPRRTLYYKLERYEITAEDYA